MLNKELNEEKVLEPRPRAAPRPRTAPKRPHAANNVMHSVTPARFLARFRYQLLFGVLVTVILPSAIAHLNKLEQAWTEPPGIGASAGALVGFLLALYLFRRVVTLPGVGVAGHVLPALAAGYGIVFSVFLALRLDYSRLSFGISFVMAGFFLFVVGTYLRHRKGQRFYLVPSPGTAALTAIPGVDWILLRDPKLPPDAGPVLIADLSAEMGDDWERLIATTALAGHPVYHLKQVQESITGRVEIEHLVRKPFRLAPAQS